MINPKEAPSGMRAVAAIKGIGINYCKCCAYFSSPVGCNERFKCEAKSRSDGTDVYFVEESDKYKHLLVEMQQKADALMAWDNNILDDPRACSEYKKCVQDMLEITMRVGNVLSNFADATKDGGER